METRKNLTEINPEIPRTSGGESQSKLIINRRQFLYGGVIGGLALGGLTPDDLNAQVRKVEKPKDDTGEKAKQDSIEQLEALTPKEFICRIDGNFISDPVERFKIYSRLKVAGPRFLDISFKINKSMPHSSGDNRDLMVKVELFANSGRYVSEEIGGGIPSEDIKETKESLVEKALLFLERELFGKEGN